MWRSVAQPGWLHEYLLTCSRSRTTMLLKCLHSKAFERPMFLSLVWGSVRHYCLYIILICRIHKAHMSLAIPVHWHGCCHVYPTGAKLCLKASVDPPERGCSVLLTFPSCSGLIHGLHCTAGHTPATPKSRIPQCLGHTLHLCARPAVSCSELPTWCEVDCPQRVSCESHSNKTMANSLVLLCEQDYYSLSDSFFSGRERV